MFKRIEKLKELNYEPTSIIDIGAHKGCWTRDMLKIYPHSNYYLFEAGNYNELNIYNTSKFEVYKNVILNDKKTVVDWYSINGTGDSFFKENSEHYSNVKPVKKQTIDFNTFIIENQINIKGPNIFLKIDCQGAEIPILKGSSNILEYTNFILLEIPFFGEYNQGVSNFKDHIFFMDEIGFIPYDIVENHYVRDINIQVDMIFINKNFVFNK